MVKNRMVFLQVLHINENHLPSCGANVPISRISFNGSCRQSEKKVIYSAILCYSASNVEVFKGSESVTAWGLFSLIIDRNVSIKFVIR